MQNLVITNTGQELMAKLIQGETTARFTKLCTSEHDYSNVDLKTIASLDDIKQSVEVSDVFRTDNTVVQVTAAVYNTDLAEDEGYFIRAIGLYALDVVENQEILYAVWTEMERPDYLPGFSGKTVSSITYRLNTKVDNASQVSLQLNPAAIPTIEQVKALQRTIELHTNDELCSTDGVHGMRVVDGIVQYLDDLEWKNAVSDEIVTEEEVASMVDGTYTPGQHSSSGSGSHSGGTPDNDIASDEDIADILNGLYS